MKLLLINPKFPESFWSFKWASETILPNRRTTNPPLGLATLAALCPEDWEVEIVDENIEPIPLNPRADIVGICGMGVQFQRQRELLGFYRGKGFFVVAGGSYTSLCPELYEPLADTVVAGEAEYIWKDFCRDFDMGSPRKLYQETGVVDLNDSPVPRFDLLKLDRYQAVSLQFSRGCPFRCEFCDIIVIFGRKPRTKSLEQVGRELDELRKINVHHVFFVDDNLIGNKPVAKNLLKFLGDYQHEYNYRFYFGTEASINLAQDQELLQLFQRANFQWVFIGIESPEEGSLRETKKYQNTREDLLTSIRKIYAHGIEIFAGFIIGFDNDTREIFEKQYQFIMKSGIHAAMVGLLTALPKTPLYERLEKEGRLIPDVNNSDNTKLGTNVVPKQMGYDEMVDGYRRLYHRLLDYRSIADRIRVKSRYLGKPAYRIDYSLAESVNIVSRFLRKGIMAGGFSRMFHFLRSIPLSQPGFIPMVIKDWIMGLAMRDYVERNFIQEFESANQLARKHLSILERTFQRHLLHGNLEFSLEQVKNAAAKVTISLKGVLDQHFFHRAAPLLEKVLKNTTSSITLNIIELQETQVEHLHRLLKRLDRYGDRVYIMLSKKVRHIIDIDSSVFNLVLEGNTLS